jgi:hypothetical protein
LGTSFVNRVPAAFSGSGSISFALIIVNALIGTAGDWLSNRSTGDIVGHGIAATSRPGCIGKTLVGILA